MLTIITPTGLRPDAFALCQRMMARQTYSGTVHWIIVDDGETPLDVPFARDGWDVEIIRPEPFWTPGDNTQGRNLLAGLNAIKGQPEALTVVEDDDWYGPGWLQWIADNIHWAELIGEGWAIYYNVRVRRWSRLLNDEHASLRCTALRGKAIDTFRDVLARPYDYYDMRLWKAHSDKWVSKRTHTLGMKGLPGRPGIALGHYGARGRQDADASVLRSLIGDDADWYLPFYQENKMAKDDFVVVKAFRYNRRDWKPGERFEPVKRIDAELFEHARKIKRADVPAPKREMKVETQTRKLAEETITKAPAVEEIEEETPAEEAEAETAETETLSDSAPAPRLGRRRRFSKDA